MRRLLLGLAGAGLLASAGYAQAAVIISTLGNDAPGFNDGDFVATPAVAAAQAGEPAPFDPGNASNGNEVLGPNFSQSWTHMYGFIADTILSATLQIGIHDSEGGSVGQAETMGVPSGTPVTLADEQLDVFNVDGTSLKPELITAGFEDGGQGENGQYEEYLVTLPMTFFADLMDGMAVVNLGLKGPVFSPAALVFLDDAVNDFNAATLVFSKLTITTQDPGPGPGPGPGGMPAPEPASAVLLGLGLLGIGGRALRRRRARVRR